jgi:hypothetical protein
VSAILAAFTAMPSIVVEVATSRFGLAALVIVGGFTVAALVNVVVIPIRERRADRRAARRPR